MKSRIILLSLVLSCVTATLCTAQVECSSMEFDNKNPGTLFPGAIIESGSLDEDSLCFADVPLDSVAFVPTIPMSAMVTTTAPSYDNFMKAVREGVKEAGMLKQYTSFSYAMNELKSYKDLSAYFGEVVNRTAYTGMLPEEKTKKTLAIVAAEQIYFSVIGDAFIKPEVREQYKGKGLICVNQVNFGQKILVLLESDAGFGELKTAYQHMFDGKSVDEKDRSIIGDASVRIMSLCGGRTIETNPDNPFEALREALNRKVDAGYFGAPVSFTATCLDDGSVYEHKFSY